MTRFIGLFLGPTSDCFTPNVGPREWSISQTTATKQQYLRIKWSIAICQIKDGCHGLLFEQTRNTNVRMCPLMLLVSLTKYLCIVIKQTMTQEGLVGDVSVDNCYRMSRFVIFWK